MTFLNNTDIPDSVLERAMTLHTSYGGILTWSEICDELALPIHAESLRKRVQRYKRNRRDIFLLTRQESRTNGNGSASGDVIYNNNDFEGLLRELLEKSDILEQISEDDTDPVHQLARIMLGVMNKRDSTTKEGMYVGYPEYLDDTEKWLEWQFELAKRVEFIRVASLYDIHIPDDSRQAMNLTYSMLRDFEPHIVIYGGDIYDLDVISRFVTHRRRRTRDVIKECEGRWLEITDTIDHITPDGTRQVAFKGNHDNRFNIWNNENPLPEVTEERFVEMVRANGKVWWLGDKQETYVRDYLLEHGKRTGENSAKNSLKDNGWAVPKSQGHGHRPNTYIHRINKAQNLINYRVVMSVASGTLCNVPPHYQMDSDQSTWINGIVLGHVAAQEFGVYLQNMIYQYLDDGSMWTVLGKDVHRAKSITG